MEECENYELFDRNKNGLIEENETEVNDKGGDDTGLLDEEGGE